MGVCCSPIDSELRVMLWPKIFVQALSKSLSFPAIIMITRSFAGTGWPFSRMPNKCSDSLEQGDGDRDEIVE